MRDKNIINYILKKGLRLKAINHLGGKCIKCGETNTHVLVFHHKNPNEKDFNIGHMKGNFENVIINELNKCDLLCVNCHHETHFNMTNNQNIKKTTNDTRLTKNLFLEFKNKFQCEICGYNKCLASLGFHHIDPQIKKYEISYLKSYQYKSIAAFDEKLIKELDKCQVICANCHAIKHTNLEKYNMYEKEIIKKSIEYKPLVKKIKDDMFIKMYNENCSYLEISRYFNCSLTTVCDKAKRLLTKKIIQPRKSRINQYC